MVRRVVDIHHLSLPVLVPPEGKGRPVTGCSRQPDGYQAQNQRVSDRASMPPLDALCIKSPSGVPRRVIDRAVGFAEVSEAQAYMREHRNFGKMITAW